MIVHVCTSPLKAAYELNIVTTRVVLCTYTTSANNHIRIIFHVNTSRRLRTASCLPDSGKLAHKKG